MATVKERTDRLQTLLRGEIAAVETYCQAREKVGNEPGASELSRLESDHQNAADILRQHLMQRGAQPPAGSGAWGAWAKAVTGTAKLFGATPAMKVLKEGEEHGVKEYEEALEDESLDPECKSLIRGQLLPRQRAHISVLDHLMSSQSHKGCCG